MIRLNPGYTVVRIQQQLSLHLRMALPAINPAIVNAAKSPFVSFVSFIHSNQRDVGT